jgi:threonylcarbamoyladenosine tRNA methylthiotransferase MtaB
MRYSIITFGCRVNQADSLGFEADLLASGASAVPPEAADLVVVNTCSVTASADQGARQIIRRVARDNPSARIVVTGCYATRRPDEVRELPGVVSVVPNDDKPRLFSLVRGIRLQADVPTMPTTAARFGDGEGSCGAVIEPGVAGRTAYTLRVQTGCAEPCAYCIIPTTRGRPRSVPIPSVLSEIERVSAAGFKEIALTGVHLGSYGRDLRPASSLVELLEALSSLERGLSTFGRLRSSLSIVEGSGSGEGCGDPLSQLLFRISSLEPMDCTSEVVALVAENDCFAPHFHLPLQHASNRVLRAMRRPYRIEQFASLVDDIRTRIPHAAIGSDVIVGFPGETDEDFDELASYLERSPLTHVHVFPYSDRPGTAATGMPGKVPGTAIRERARRVREISERLAQKFRESQVGTVHRALTLEDGTLAVTGNYMKVRIPPGRTRNAWIHVRITGADGSSVKAEICDDHKTRRHGVATMRTSS